VQLPLPSAGDRFASAGEGAALYFRGSTADGLIQITPYSAIGVVTPGHLAPA